MGVLQIDNIIVELRFILVNSPNTHLWFEKFVVWGKILALKCVLNEFVITNLIQICIYASYTFLIQNYLNQLIYLLFIKYT